MWFGLFFVATLPFVYLNGGFQTAVDIALGSFSGQLQNVDTSCFMGGECSAEIDGRHVTIAVGSTEQAAGTIIGANGIGGLGSHLGEKVQVYAKRLSFRKFTLVGSNRYYIRVGKEGTVDNSLF